MRARLTRSTNSNKKFKVVISSRDKTKTIHFGDSRYEDYTIHHDDERKENYLARHGVNETWDDPFTAGFWARWLLWNEETIAKSKKFISDNFGIEFVD